MWVTCLINIEQKMYEEKYFKPNICPMQQYVLIKLEGLQSRMLVYHTPVSCLTSISDLRNPKTTIQHAKNRFKIARYEDILPYSSFVG